MIFGSVVDKWPSDQSHGCRLFYVGLLIIDITHPFFTYLSVDDNTRAMLQTFYVYTYRMCFVLLCKSNNFEWSAVPMPLILFYNQIYYF